MRWSSEPQTWGDSERRQEKLAQDWCQREGRELVEANFTDRGKSAWHGQHRQNGNLGALLKAVRAGDTILIEDTDRWSREPVLDSLNALRDTVNQGVQIVFLKTGVPVNKNNFNDPNVLIPNFLGSFLANAENEKRSYRIREAMTARREQLKQGKAVRGRLPAWLRWDNEKGEPVVVSEKAKLVRLIFRRCLDGKGVKAIEREMRTYPPISNSKRAAWNSRFVHRLLTDKSVIGWHMASDTPNIYPKIVDEEEFFAAGVKLRDRRHLTVREACADHNLFTGLVRCARCCHTLVRHSSRAGGRIYAYLYCTGRQRGLSECPSRGAPYDQFEASFLSLVTQADLVRRALSGSDVTSTLEAIQGRIVENEKQCEKIMRLIDEMDDPPRHLAERLQQLEAQAQALHGELEAESAKAAVPPLQAYDQLAKDFSGRLSDPEVRLKVREGIRGFIERIELDPVLRSYTVRLKGIEQPIKVGLNEGGWSFSPAPLWLTDQGAYQAAVTAGRFSNIIGQQPADA
jgi:DNA invertase Pin-like site-specific DNA recombinase